MGKVRKEKAETEKELLASGPNSSRAKAFAAKHSISLKVSEQELSDAMTPDQRSQWNELKAELHKIEAVEPPAPPQGVDSKSTP